MIPLYNKEDFELSKSTDELPCKCEACGSTFFIMKKNITHELKHKRNRIRYCSQKCNNEVNNISNKKIVTCLNCKNELLKKASEIKKSKSDNHFCSKSCACIYHNAHKTKGYSRSKLEIWLESQLTLLYPTLDIHYNRKDVINSELDIYIPSLKLAFELNGIFHYEPIFGVDKLNQIQNNDNRKYQACIETNIELCLIDTSQQKYFKPTTSQKYLDIIISIINNKSMNIC